MAASFVAGALAGYAIAIPVGAIAILIVELGIRRGFRVAAAAGAGAATADFAYATIAIVGGVAVAAALEPWARPLRVVAIGALLGIGLRGLIGTLVRPGRVPAAAAVSTGVVPTYARFVALTMLNPATVIYFAALILALPDLGDDALERVAFVLGAFLASLSWQTMLAALGAVAHHRLPARFQVGLSLVGNLAICGFAVALAGSLR
jgi:threonine/homoserine/homoserine lactone efflux protein